MTQLDILRQGVGLLNVHRGGVHDYGTRIAQRIGVLYVIGVICRLRTIRLRIGINLSCISIYSALSRLVYASVFRCSSLCTRISRDVISVGPLPTNTIHQTGTPYKSNPLDQPDKPRQITYVTMTNERWKWMVRGHVGPNPGSLQWNEYKTELYPVPNLWLMDPRRSGIDRWSLVTARLPLWEILLHRVWKQNFVFRDYLGTVSLATRALDYS
jgi:hypothetical protein